MEVSVRYLFEIDSSEVATIFQCRFASCRSETQRARPRNGPTGGENVVEGELLFVDFPLDEVRIFA
jgi:hypothetical protein